jgi:pyruvate/2-oxoglutarate dehydrogenase complex dihydrolipoamide dehydrogenase (E3) component
MFAASIPCMDNYENLVVGSGEAGKYLAWTMAKAGRRTALVERKFIGGSCPNIACLPSKNVIHSAKIASLVKRAHEFGLEGHPLATSMTGVLHRKQKMVNDLIELHLERFQASGAELIMGNAQFIGERTVEVSLNGGGSRVLAAERLFLNLGTRTSMPDVAGLAAAKPMTHIKALDLDRLPGHLVVLGGGYVGLELAQAIRRFGSLVTVIQRGSQLASGEDADVGSALFELFREEGIEVLLEATVREVSGRSGEEIRIIVDNPSGTRNIQATDLVVATGRTPNTQSIGVETLGVELDSRGYIKVNDRLETTAQNVWALGDCAGSPQFTHAAYDDFRIVRDNLNGGNRSTRNRLVPSCLFTDPELVRVGLNESDAKILGIEYRLAKMPMATVLRTRTISEPRGFIKVLIGAHSDAILGLTAFGAEASELLAAVQTAMLGGLPYTLLRDGIFTHPTISEGLVFLLANVPAKVSQGSAA